MQLNQLIKTRVEESLVGRKFSLLCACSLFQFEKFIIFKKSRLVSGLFDCDVGLVVYYHLVFFTNLITFKGEKNPLVLVILGSLWFVKKSTNFTDLRKDEREKDREKMKILILNPSSPGEHLVCWKPGIKHQFRWF